MKDRCKYLHKILGIYWDKYYICVINILQHELQITTTTA